MKKSLRASECDTPQVMLARTAYRKNNITAPLRKRFTFVDESCSNIAMTRLFGRAVRIRSYDDTHRNMRFPTATLFR